jgi:hypothetical protein
VVDIALIDLSSLRRSMAPSPPDRSRGIEDATSEAPKSSLTRK